MTIWIFNKNKKEHKVVRNNQEILFRDRTNEILFMDLRQKGHPYEKKYVEFTQEDRKEVTNIFHSWQSSDSYNDVVGLCKSVHRDELDDYSLIPSKYIEFDKTPDESDSKTFNELKEDLFEIQKQSLTLKQDLLKTLEELSDELD